MKDKIMKFHEMLSSSEDMQKKLAELNKAFAEKHEAPSPDAGAEAFISFRKQALDEIVIPVAKEAGFDFTSDDLVTYVQDLAGKSGQELNTDELQAVSGGTGVFACVGLGIGFGPSNHDQDSCVLVGYGVGACAITGAEVG